MLRRNTFQQVFVFQRWLRLGRLLTVNMSVHNPGLTTPVQIPRTQVKVDLVAQTSTIPQKHTGRYSRGDKKLQRLKDSQSAWLMQQPREASQDAKMRTGVHTSTTAHAYPFTQTQTRTHTFPLSHYIQCATTQTHTNRKTEQKNS